ncbi:hypothetical protein FRC20_000360 [Serendipita sp. 405]|nr:hypothetical protein FRC16_000316 [Serendipita sp. 398]KAG8857075.1 hypothetical protein FRC20_000360 [Serendipita sp. 405]
MCHLPSRSDAFCFPGSQFTVGAFQKVSFAFGTCIYTFTNTNFLPVQWCDSTWAAQGGAIASSCSAGGSCFGLLYTVSVENNPNPQPVSTPTPTPTPTPSPRPTSTKTSSTIQPAETEPVEMPAGGNNPNPSTTPSSTTSRNAASISSTSGIAISEFSSVLSPSNLADISSSLSLLSSLTVTSSRMQRTTLSNGIVITLPTDDGSSPVPTESPSEQSSKKKNLAGIIAGVIIGCFILLGIIIAVFKWRRKRKEVKAPIGIYIDPTIANEFGGPGVGKAGGPGSPIARTIYTNSDGDEHGFGRAARGTSMMSGDTDLTIWTPRARAGTENGISAMPPLSPLLLDTHRLSVNYPTPEMASIGAAAALEGIRQGKVADSPPSNHVQPIDTSANSSPSENTTTPVHSTYPYRFINSTMFNNPEQTAQLVRKSSSNSTEGSFYSREDTDVDERYLSAPPVVIPELMSPSSSTKRITDVSVGAVGGMSGTGFGLGRSRESGAKSRVTSVGTTYQRDETLRGLDAEIEEIRQQQQQQQQQLLHNMPAIHPPPPPPGRISSEYEQENAEDAYAGFARLTQAFESASSVHQVTMESSGVSRESLVPRRL